MIKSSVEEIAAADRSASIEIDEDAGMVSATVIGPSISQASTIFVATYTKEATVSIKRGENAGRKITYHNVVDELMTVGPWQGGESQKVSLPKPNPGEGTVIWLQDDGTGRILTASYVEG